MRALVTGASGFIGSALCAQLLERGFDVVSLVRRPGSEPGGTRAVVGDLADTRGRARRGCAAHRRRVSAQRASSNARAASSATWRAIASDEVAAGEGALRT